MKKLRKKLYPKKIRFKMCGEYGEDQDPTTTVTIGRPHYHALIFGHQFDDLEQIDKNEQGDPLYTSPLLAEIWGKGNVIIGDVTFESAAYVARYIMKKINGAEEEEHYKKPHPFTGEVLNLTPEFSSQSNRPGIGADWVKKYKNDLRKGFITLRGLKLPIPDFYLAKLETLDYPAYEEIKEKTRQAMDFMDPENTLDRLRVKEKIKLLRTESLSRNLA